MANLTKITLVIIVAVLLTLTFSQLEATWDCPCYKVYCEDDTIYAGFCLPTETLDYYYFWYGEPGHGGWQHIDLAPEMLNDCDTGCTWYHTEVYWDCDDEYGWFITFGLSGLPIEWNIPDDECYE